METITRAGRVSAYGFACGHVEQRALNGFTMTLRQESGVFIVTKYNYNDRPSPESFGVCVVNATCDTLKEARKLYASL